MRLNCAEPFFNRNWFGEAHPFDGEAGLRRHAAGILKGAAHIPVPARFKDRCFHDCFAPVVSLVLLVGLLIQ
jgi:hypothetical protein